MSSRAFSHDPDLGITRTFHYDHATDTACIQTEQDVTDLIADSKAQFNDIDERANWKGDMHRVASIPLSVYFELKQRGILKDPKAMKAWLNDKDNQFFRTRPGTV